MEREERLEWREEVLGCFGRGSFSGDEVAVTEFGDTRPLPGPLRLLLPPWAPVCGVGKGGFQVDSERRCRGRRPPGPPVELAEVGESGPPMLRLRMWEMKFRCAAPAEAEEEEACLELDWEALEESSCCFREKAAGM